MLQTARRHFLVGHQVGRSKKDSGVTEVRQVQAAPKNHRRRRQAAERYSDLFTSPVVSVDAPAAAVFASFFFVLNQNWTVFSPKLLFQPQISLHAANVISRAANVEL